jgi:DNA polymerase-3 subunit delta'
LGLNAFDIIEKQGDLTAMMDRVVANDRLGHAYIFEGMMGAGQEDMALYLAAGLNCLNPSITGQPCGECNHCVRILREDYPDVLHVRPGDDKGNDKTKANIFATDEEIEQAKQAEDKAKPESNAIKIDQVRELKHRMSMSSTEGNHQIFVIHEAEKMTTGAANSLLKFIEEPYENMHIFLITSNQDALLPTILSRCQMIHFPELRKAQVKQVFEAAGIKASLATTLSYLTNDVEEAKDLADNETFQTQIVQSIQWIDLMVKGDPRGLTMVQSDWVKDKPSRKAMIQALNLVGFHFHDLLYLKLGSNDDQSQMDKLVFPNDLGKYQTMLKHLDAALITKGLHLVGKAQRMIRANVAPQAAMEYLVLAFWKK